MGADKTAALRQHESYCYQIAYYLLRDEAAAVQATVQTLLELVRDDGFFAKNERMQRRTSKLVAMRKSLTIARANAR